MAQGIKTPFALSRKTELNYAICYRLWHEQSTRVSLKTLAVLCETLDRRANSFLHYTKNEGSPRTRSRKKER
jgi:DNA-binding Xre family transcriptional regulator